MLILMDERGCFQGDRWFLIYSHQNEEEISSLDILKVSKFQNEFMKSLFLPKYEQKLSRFLPCVVKAEILTIFGSYFGRNDDFINSF